MLSEPIPFRYPVKLYFTYSALIDRPTLDRLWLRRTGQPCGLVAGQYAELVDVDVAINCPSDQWGGRIAGLVPAKGHRVPGMLFAVDVRDWPTVRSIEEHPHRLEVRARALLDGVEVHVTTYTTRPERVTRTGSPSRDYLEALCQGVGGTPFAPTWADRLHQLAEDPGVATDRNQRHSA